MDSREVRESFLRYYKDNGHLIFPSSSLIPTNDPTLLLTNSGMAQFKNYFSGEEKPPFTKIVTAQKCFRAVDIDEVGDESHLTLFEMLGNFSFGEYFKQEAIDWALELITHIYKLPIERLFITVHNSDYEAEKIWLAAGFQDNKIYKYGDKDNWWGPAGTEGPCGPCSEIHYYLGPQDELKKSHNKLTWGPNLSSEFVELYNLVFTQYYRDTNGNDEQLPHKNIDTGLGLERLLAILNKTDIFQTDLYKTVIELITTRSKPLENLTKYDILRYKRIVADHCRSASFLIADGVVPSNTGRGYILRRLIRKAIVFGLKYLNIASPICSPISDEVCKIMGNIYKELSEKKDFITQVLDAEENGFAMTLINGSKLLDGIIDTRIAVQDANKPIPRILSADFVKKKLDSKNLSKSKQSFYNKGSQLALQQLKQDANHNDVLNWCSELTGSELFLLYDTYGFPHELTLNILKEKNIKADIEGFFAKLDKHRAATKALTQSDQQISSNNREIYRNLLESDTQFTGYETTEDVCKIIKIIHEGNLVNQLKDGQIGQIITDKTPFFAEKGGQVGDTGYLKIGNIQNSVTNTKYCYAKIISHFVKAETTLKVGSKVLAVVSKERREKIRRNHTATHLVHAALRDFLGTQVRQMGSLVAEDNLRFDFTYMKPLAREEINQVEKIVNQKIRENLKVTVHHTTLQTALEEGALAFFDEKYSSTVRTIKIEEPWSYELCGGTHMDRTGGIGLFKIISEYGIGSGMRRLTAITGIGTEQYVNNLNANFEKISRLLKVPKSDLESKITRMQSEVINANNRIRELRKRLLDGNSNNVSSDDFRSKTVKTKFGNVVINIQLSDEEDSSLLREILDKQRNVKPKHVLLIAARINEKPTVFVAISEDLKKHGYKATNIAKEVAIILGGGGGGKDHLAQAGGKSNVNLRESLDKIFERLANFFGNSSHK